MTIFREGRSRDVNIRVSSDRELGKALLSSVTERFGIEVKPVGKTDAKKYGLSDSKGVLVGRVEAKGPFGLAGIESGDIILQINRKTVAEPDEFGEVLSTTPPGTNIILTVVDHRSLNASIVQVSAP